jgi:PAS domain S-box-containing protein
MARSSLRWRLSALVAALVVATIGVTVLTSYDAMRVVLLRAASDRAESAAVEVARLLAQTKNNRPVASDQSRAAEGAYADFLADPSGPHRAALDPQLQRLLPGSQQSVVELWTAAGTRALQVAKPTEAMSALGEGRKPTAAGIRIEEGANHVAVLEATQAIKGADGQATVGWVLLRRTVAASTNPAALRGLVGSGSRILLAASPTGPWTDLDNIVPGPPAASPRSTAFPLAAPDGDQRIGAVADAAGTSWIVEVDFSRAAILMPAAQFLLDVSIIGFFLVGLSVVVGRVATIRVIQPLNALTRASETIACGDYSARVPESRGDELGRLGGAFNAMAAELDTSRARLEKQVRERTEALEALQHSEARHRAIVSVAFDSIITIDISGRITEFNPAAERTFGFARADVMGQELAGLIVPARHREAHRNGLARYLETGAGPMIGRLLEMTAIRADGSEFPIEFSIQQVQIDGQTLFTAYLRDLTERRRTDELRLRSLTLEAENRQVREASRLKSEFLANMSHELRTPLNAIIGFSTILRDTADDIPPEQRTEFLGDILVSGRHLLQLINDVLDLSKVEAGKLEFRPEFVEIDRVVREVLSVLKETAASKGITLVVDIEPLSEVFLDAGRLKQVLYNYVSNALKFTPTGGRVTIRVRHAAAGTWRLEVEDSGIGIAEQDLSRLFIEFEQLDGSAGKQHGGTGLGLALTKRLVEAQGGQIGVRSTLGAGSVFWAVLPREYTGPAERRQPPTVATGDGPAILVIEDDPRDRAQLVEALTAAGFSVEAVATGAEAVSRSEARFFAAITLDLLLPDQSGLDVLQEIRARGLNPDARIVVVTVVAERHALAGHLVADILSKPIDVSALLASLRRAGVVPGKAVRVLVVDDDPTAIRLAQVVLEGAGFEVESHTDAEIGLASAVAKRPAAIVLDLLMPGMDGFQFLTELRRSRSGQTTPVIVWTAKELSPAEQRRLADAARAVVRKGPGASELASELQAMLTPVATEG